MWNTFIYTLLFTRAATRRYASADLCDRNVSVRLSPAGKARYCFKTMKASLFYFSDAKFHPDCLRSSPDGRSQTIVGWDKKHSWRWQTRATRKHAKIVPIRRVYIRYDTIRYDTIGEFNVDWKAEYSALSSTRSQKKKLKQTTPVPL